MKTSRTDHLKIEKESWNMGGTYNDVWVVSSGNRNSVLVETCMHYKREMAIRKFMETFKNFNLLKRLSK